VEGEGGYTTGPGDSDEFTAFDSVTGPGPVVEAPKGALETRGVQQVGAKGQGRRKGLFGWRHAAGG